MLFFKLYDIEYSDTFKLFIVDFGTDHTYRIEDISGVHARIYPVTVHSPAVDRFEIGIRLIYECDGIVITGGRQIVLQIADDILRGVVGRSQGQVKTRNRRGAVQQHGVGGLVQSVYRNGVDGY